MSEYYYTLHDGDNDYAATTIPSIEGEKISQFGVRIVAENDFDGRTCLVYPCESSSTTVAIEKKAAFARAAKVADLFQQQHHGSVTRPFRVEMQPPPQDAGDKMERFLTLLRSRMISPNNQVLNQLIRHYAASVSLIRDADAAVDLYYAASRIPRTATEIVLRNKGISVAQPFQASDPAKAVLLHAFRDGFPMILKISTPESIRNEVKVMNTLKEHGLDDNSHLVFIEEVEFESGSVECAVALSENHPTTRSGLLMKHFQTTLAQCKIPLSENILLNYGRQIEVAVKFLHSAGICHLDIKPSNIFLFERNCHLGDYGAAKHVGEEIHEISRNYYPSDLPIKAETKTDFLLLAKTMLELFGEINSPVKPMSTDEIVQAVHKVKNERVRSFLESLLE